MWSSKFPETLAWNKGANFGTYKTHVNIIERRLYYDKIYNRSCGSMCDELSFPNKRACWIHFIMINKSLKSLLKHFEIEFFEYSENLNPLVRLFDWNTRMETKLLPLNSPENLVYFKWVTLSLSLFLRSRTL